MKVFVWSKGKNDRQGTIWAWLLGSMSKVWSLRIYISWRNRVVIVVFEGEQGERHCAAYDASCETFKIEDGCEESL